MDKTLVSICAGPMLVLLSACGGGGSEPGPVGGTSAALPANATPIVHDTSRLALNQTEETLVGESEPQLSAPEDVVYPYDPADPDAKNPEATTVRLRSQCTTRTYDITSNPEKVAMYSNDGNVSYPGALLRGDQFRAGELRKLGVRPEHRQPVVFVINNVYSQSGDASGSVPQPDLKPVQDAVKARIVAAFNDNIPIGDSVAYSYEETSNIGRFMLKAKVSARYGGISGALGTKVAKRQSERSIVVNLVQKLYDVEVQQPPTKDDWFNADFFGSGLQPLLDAGEISAANPPVYVSRVTYGRVLTFTMTTTASRSDVDTMLRASVKTLVAGGSLSLDAKSSNINSRKKVNVTQIGGNGAAAITAAESGDWGAFFKQQLQLTEAVPIQVEYRNLYDNSPAGVTESTRVDEEVCTPQIVVPGPFDFALEDHHERPAGIGAVQQMASGDLDGDGIADLVWNELVGNTNRLYVGYGTMSGRMRIDARPCGGQSCDFSDGSTPWGQYKLHVGDFNGDGRKDLMWLRASKSFDTAEVRILAAAGAGGTGFAGPLQSLSVPLEAAARDGMRDDPIVADMNKDGRDDLMLWFVRRVGSQNRVFQRLLRSDAATPGAGLVAQDEAIVGGFSDYFNANPATARFQVFARDIDSDGWQDLIVTLLGQDFSTPASDERNVAAEFLNTKVADAVNFAQGPTFVHPSSFGWSGYVPLTGDFDGDGDTDLAWVRTTPVSPANLGAVHQATYDGSSRAFVPSPLQWWTTGASADTVNVIKLLTSNDRLYVMDSNGDAAADVVVTNYLTVAGQSNFVNGIAVMKGVRNGSVLFNTSTAAQQHPVNQDWQNYTFRFVGDFNGDGLQDVLWNNAALDNSLFIAFAKREAEQDTF